MLDIIIPTYNDEDDLIATLSSIAANIIKNKNNIKVTVVDDCSTTTDFDKILSIFNFNLLRLEKNSGPGAARQYGIDHTSNPYILCIDAGDMFINVQCIHKILRILNNNPDKLLFIGPFLNINSEANEPAIQNIPHAFFHGSIFKRKFFKKYNIRIPSASHYQEDTAFMNTCLMLTTNNTDRFEYDEPFIIKTYKETSLSHNNTPDLIKNISTGLMLNAEELIPQLQINKLPYKDLVNHVLILTYFDLTYLQMNDDPINYDIILKRYKEFFKKYPVKESVLKDNSFLYNYYRELYGSLPHFPLAYMSIDIKTFLLQMIKECGPIAQRAVAQLV